MTPKGIWELNWKQLHELPLLHGWSVIECIRTVVIFLYHECPKSHTWTQQAKTSHVRQRYVGSVVGRVHTVHPSAGELYYFRLLLTAVRGATSIQDVRRSSDGDVCQSYHGAASRRGSIGTNEEWLGAMADVAASGAAYQLINFFTYLLLHCDVPDPWICGSPVGTQWPTITHAKQEPRQRVPRTSTMLCCSI